MNCPICTFKAKTKSDLARHMALIHTAALVMVLFMFTGCTQWKKLTGDRPHDPAPQVQTTPTPVETEDLTGLWTGSLGSSEHVNLNVNQKDNEILGNTMLTLNYSQYGYVHFIGAVSEKSFIMTGSNGSLCPNSWTLDGEVRENSMVVHIKTLGNAVNGTVCFPRPIDETIALAR